MAENQSLLMDTGRHNKMKEEDAGPLGVGKPGDGVRDGGIMRWEVGEKSQ